MKADKKIETGPTANVDTIADDIRKTLEKMADIAATRIRVDIQGSKVVLRGKVHSWEERKAVAHVAWSTPGISQVVDKIVIE